jgi:hypothetical protein
MKRVCLSHPNVSRRAFLGTAASAGTVLGAGLLVGPASARAAEHPGENFRPNAIPGVIAPFAPFAIFIHHKPPTPGIPLASINEPSQITDFNGFVGITRIRGGGIGTNTVTGASTNLAFSADMGFNQGEFMASNGQRHEGTFGFV